MTRWCHSIHRVPAFLPAVALTLSFGLIGLAQEKDGGKDDRIALVEGAIKSTVDSQKEGLARVVGEILTTTKAPEDKRPALEAAAAKAVSGFEERTRQQMENVYRKLQKEAGGSPPGAVQVYEEHWVVYREEKAGTQVPPEQTAWLEDLQRILSREEYALWDAEMAKRRKSVEEALEAYVQESADKNVVERRQQMERRVDDLVIETGFPKEKIDALKNAVAEVAEKSRQPSADIAREFGGIFARNAYLGMYPNVLEVFRAGSNRFPGMEKSLAEVSTVDMDDAVRNTLSAAEYATWEKAKNEAKNRLEKAIGDYLDRLVDARRLERKSDLERQVERLVGGLPVDEKRAKVLREGIDGVVEASLKAWREGQEKPVRTFVKSSGNSEEEILDYLEQGSVRFNQESESGESSAAAIEEAAFEKLLVSQLTAEERKRWKSVESDRIQRRAKAMAMVAVSEVDRSVRLTPGQRGQLEPLLVTVLEEYLPFVEDQENFGYMLQNSEGLLVFLQGIPSEKVKEIIHPNQKKQWDQAGSRYSGWWQNMEAVRKAAGKH